MDRRAGLRRHQRLAEEAAAEVRHDHRHVRKARSGRRQRQRIAAAGDRAPSAGPDASALRSTRSRSARRRAAPCSPATSNSLPPARRRDDSDAARETGTRSAAPSSPYARLRALDRIRRRGVQHEEADEPIRMARHRYGDRLLVARHARNQRRARDVMAIELGHPAIGQRVRRARRVPSQLRPQSGPRVAPASAPCFSRPSASKKRAREEVAVGVVHRDLIMPT